MENMRRVKITRTRVRVKGRPDPVWAFGRPRIPAAAATLECPVEMSCSGSASRTNKETGFTLPVTSKGELDK